MSAPLIRGLLHGEHSQPVHIHGHNVTQGNGQWTIARSNFNLKKVYLISEDETCWKLWRWDGQKITSDRPVRVHKLPWNRKTTAATSTSQPTS